MEQLKSSLTDRSLKSTLRSQLGVLIEKYSLLCSVSNAHPHVGHSSGATGDDCVSRGSSIAMVVSTYPAMSKI